MALNERYELIRVIGAGGMAQVFEGVTRGAAGFERRVAIKRLVPEHADDETFQRMFVDEARIASHLHHGNIVQVLDYGSVEGSQFLVLEFVDGPDASRAARIGARVGAWISPSVALHLVAEIAHALDYAHNRRDDEGRPLQIVHRDVSPGNVLLSWEGDVKLSDFGIATATLREERTRTGLIKGKASYMPPEQAAGEALSGAADLYALGATLSALVFGAPRREDRDAKRVAASPEIAALVDRCMDPDPALRPSAAELAENCEALRASKGAGRSELRRWLAALQPHVDGGQTRPSPFDQMLGLCLVPATEGGGEFTVSRAAPTVISKPSTGAQGQVDASTTWRGTTKTGKLLALVAGIIGLAAVVFGGMVLLRSAAGPLPAEARDLGAAQDPKVEPDRGLADSRVGLGRPDQGPADQGQPDTAALSKDATRPRPRRKARDQIKKSRPKKGKGWLRVGGSALLRGKIEVDGKRVGRAPSALRLALGKHVIVIRAPDDDRILLEKRVVIEEGHRRSTPLRLIVR